MGLSLPCQPRPVLLDRAIRFRLAYVGHAERWDKAEIDGQLDTRDCTITFRSDGRKLAVAVIHRDLEGLRAEVEFERTIAHNRVTDTSSKSV